MKVSVVTPNYNGEKFLKTFFDSLNQDSEYVGEVIIVDNGSSDRSREYIENNSFNFPVKLIENTKNLGFAPAVNQAVKAIAVARAFLKEDAINIACIPSFTETTVADETRTGIKFTVIRI